MNNKKRKQFGARLKELRIRATLTQRGLAAKVGVTSSYLSKIEHGALAAPSTSTISKIASILKTDANELLSLAGKFPNVMPLRLREHATLEFGPKLKELRSKSGLSQLELARQVFVNPSYISKLEKGKMPPPSMKVLSKLADILKVKKSELLYLTGKVQHSPAKSEEVRTMFGNIYRSIRKNMKVPKSSPLINEGWVRVAISILLVVSIAGGLWLASPNPVQALTIGITAPSSATIGSPYQITVLVTIEDADILPIQSAYLDIQSSTSPSTYKARVTNLPLTDGGTSTSISAIGTSGTSGTVGVTAATGSNWAYADPSGARSGYGYGYGLGWNTYNLGTGYGYGYGYGGAYSGGSTTIEYTINWTPPSDWQTGVTYEIKVFVVGSGTVSFTNDTTSSFTLSAAAAPTPGDDGVPSVSSSEDVSDIVNEDGEFTRSATVSSADGRATLTIPSGTIGLTAEGDPLSEVTITNVQPPKDMPPAGTAFSMGIHFDCEPTGATFDPPALLTFEYNPNWLPPGATPDNLTIAYYDEDTGRWVELGAEDIEIDLATNTITARVSHFTIFSILVRINPASFEVSGLKISPTSADIAEKVTISATVINTGDLAGSYEVVLKINGQRASSKKVSVAGGASEQVTFTTVQSQAGSYSVNIDGLSGTFSIKAVPTAPTVIAPSVPSVQAPEVVYPAPTAPAPPAVPAPVPTPTPWLAMIIALVATSIVAGILVWYYGFRREY